MSARRRPRPRTSLRMPRARAGVGMLLLLAAVAGAGAVTISQATDGSGIRTKTQFTRLAAPEFTDAEDQAATIRGQIRPACEGRRVTLRRVNADGSTTPVRSTRTDAQGRFSLSRHVDVVTTFAVRAASQRCGARTLEEADSQEFRVKSLRFFDDFDYDNWRQMSKTWSVRQPQFQTTGERTMMRGSAAALGFGDSELDLKVLPARAKGRHLVGHVTTGRLPFTYGHFEARIKFHRPAGAHGGFWHQSGYAPGAAELDVVEWFGERGTATRTVEPQRVQHTIHVGHESRDETTQFPRFSWAPKTVAPRPVKRGTPKSQIPAPVPSTSLPGTRPTTWWDDFHTFEAYWGRSGYVFYVDGVQVGTTSTSGRVVTSPSAGVPGELILSQIVKDGVERQKLLDHLTGGGSYEDYTMTVDWVRAWR